MCEQHVAELSWEKVAQHGGSAAPNYENLAFDCIRRQFGIKHESGAMHSVHNRYRMSTIATEDLKQHKSNKQQ